MDKCCVCLLSIACNKVTNVMQCQYHNNLYGQAETEQTRAVLLSLHFARRFHRTRRNEIIVLLFFLHSFYWTTIFNGDQSTTGLVPFILVVSSKLGINSVYEYKSMSWWNCDDNTILYFLFAVFHQNIERKVL